MKNRFTVFILSFLLIFNLLTVPVIAASEKTSPQSLSGMDYIVKRLTIFTHEDRANLETILIPLFITDTGLNTLIDTVENYTPESEAFMHTLLRKFLVRVEKEEVIKTLSYLYIIDEKIREDYIGGYYERKELELSENAEEGMLILMKGLFAKYPDLEEIFAQDGITPGVVARMMQMLSEVNGGVPLFKESSQGLLEVNAIETSLKNKIDRALKESGVENVTAEMLLQQACYEINTNYSEVYRKSFVAVGSEAGFVLKSNKMPAGGSKSEVSAVDIKIDEASGKVTINGSDEKGNSLADGAYSLFAVSFKYNKNGYLLDPNGEPVRLCVYDNGVWYAFVEKLGVYTVADSAPSYFTDVNGWGKSYIDALYERKIISGRSSELFCPEDNITREEFVKLIVELFGLKGDYGSFFTDVSRDAWYYEYLSAAKYYGIVDGYEDGSFGVGKNITRQDMCKILYSVIEKADIKIASNGITLEFADRNLIADYAYPSVMALKRAGIVSGDEFGKFNPVNTATRQEAAKLIYKVLECYVKN